LTATDSRTEALPLPDAPDETAIQSTALVDVQAQPAGAVTDTTPSSPPAPVVFVVGDTVGAQIGGGAGDGVGSGDGDGDGVGVGVGGSGVGPGPAAAACATVTVRFAIVSVALRAAPVLIATVTWIAALPSPAAGVTVVIHSRSPAAVHEHPGVAARSTVTSPPELPTSRLEGVTSYLQGAASCTTSTGWSETTTDPRRWVPRSFAATE